MTPRPPWSRENTIAVIAITVSVVGILLSLFNPDVRHFLRLDQSNAANQGSVGSSPNQTLPIALTTQVPIATQTTSQATESWKGVFHQPGYSAANVELDVLFKNGGNFSGTWMAGNQGSGSYDIGTVSVAGQTALFSSLPGKVQTDLQSSFGSVPIDANTKVVLWRGQGNASNNIWPTGYYYAFRGGDTLNGIAYEYLGGDKSTFDISLQGGGSSSLGT